MEDAAAAGDVIVTLLLKLSELGGVQEDVMMTMGVLIDG